MPRKNVLIPNTKRFNETVYYKNGLSWDSKKDAQDRATDLRNHGYLVRVVKHPKWDGSGYRYVIYNRRKK